MNMTKLKQTVLRGWIVCALILPALSGPAASKFFDEQQAVTLFVFDDVSIPFSQNLKLVMRAPEKHPANPVVKRGGPKAPDSWAVQFYGSVVRDGDKYRMWYVSVGEDRVKHIGPRSSPWRAAYAESRDGVKWTKPRLGLVEYDGNRDNNLVSLEPRLGVLNLKVLHEPGSSVPYKLGTHVWFPKGDSRLGTFAPYGSSDGLRWRLLTDAQPVDFEMRPEDMVLPPLHFEPVGGMYRWDGLYHLSGQNAMAAARPYHGRVSRIYVSSDFVNWSPSSAINYVRPQQHKLLGPGRSREGEQNHEAISVWNRGNVLLGVYGLWHGDRQWEDVTVDLGLSVSNDGIRFRAPAEEWTFLHRGKDGEWDQGGLLQGQGFENINEQTFIYYGAWDPRAWQKSPPRGGVGIAVLPRDRFADLRVDESTKGKGTYQMPETQCELLTKSIEIPPDPSSRLYVNAHGLGPEAKLLVEVLRHDLTPIKGYAATVHQSGFQVPVAWKASAAIGADRIRLRVRFEGKKRADIRLHAIYLK
jgi:hypothetical protein